MGEMSSLRSELDRALELLAELKERPGLEDSVDTAIQIVASAIKAGKPILTCGNGGSASDALHISGELVGRFNLDRQALNVICLNSNPTIMTAWANDISFASVFARQVEAHGAEGAVLWGLSTSGNSENVIQAFQMARQIGMKTIAMTGSSPGSLGKLADCTLSVPGTDAPSAQNLHVILYHFICAEVERLASSDRV